MVKITKKENELEIKPLKLKEASVFWPKQLAHYSAAYMAFYLESRHNDNGDEY